MIMVVGFNMVIDYLFMVDMLELGQVQCVLWLELYFGGKGLYVVQVIVVLGECVQLVGFIDVVYCNFIVWCLVECGVLFYGVEIEVLLCCCMVVCECDGCVIEIFGFGFELIEVSCQELFDIWVCCVGESELLVFFGSLFGGFDLSIYVCLIEQVWLSVVLCLVDVSGDVLCEVVVVCFWLFKFNCDEVVDLIGELIDIVVDVVCVVCELYMWGVVLLLVMLGV